MDKKIEIDKHIAAEEQAEKQLKATETQAEKKLRAERKARYVELVIDALKFLLQLGFSVVGVLLMFTFEEKGTICSSMGRKIMDKIIKKWEPKSKDWGHGNMASFFFFHQIYRPYYGLTHNYLKEDDLLCLQYFL